MKRIDKLEMNLVIGIPEKFTLPTNVKILNFEIYKNISTIYYETDPTKYLNDYEIREFVIYGMYNKIDNDSIYIASYFVSNYINCLYEIPKSPLRN